MRLGNITALLKIDGVTLLKEVKNATILFDTIYLICDNVEYVFKGDISNYKFLLGSSMLDCTSLDLVRTIKLNK